MVRETRDFTRRPTLLDKGLHKELNCKKKTSIKEVETMMGKDEGTLKYCLYTCA